ncbi:MAG: DNA recombination protein RmuC [Gordonia sp. (in: high G+C Gram-positive bacteria)]
MLIGVIALLTGIVLGIVIGWLANASRSAAAVSAARAEADTVRAAQELAARSLSAASEDAARRQSSAIGTQVTHIVEPLRGVLGQLSEELRRVEHNRIGAYSSLTEQVRGIATESTLLRTQTRALANALHTPHIRGRWGEIQLERVVELAGMSKHCDFSTQVSAHSETLGTLRPDLVVHLAGGRTIIVDAKVPLHAYLNAIDTTSPSVNLPPAATPSPATDSLLADHAQAVRAHINKLAAKSYWTAFDHTPEFVVLFLPSDAILEAAARADHGLIEYAFTQNVVLATPATLIALLRTVALGWRHDAMTADAAVIHQLGVELYHRLESLLGHLDRVGGSLRRAVESFNSTVGVIDTRVGVTARKLASLDALGDVDEPRIPDMIDTTVRTASFSAPPADSVASAVLFGDHPDHTPTSAGG